MSDHTTRIDLDPERIADWLMVAEGFGEAAVGLVGELHGVRRDPTRHMLGRASKAARIVEARLTGSQQMVANALAGQIEDAAARPSE